MKIILQIFIAICMISLGSTAPNRTANTARYITTLTRMGHVDVKEIVKDSKIKSVGTIPEDLYHGAIVVYGFVYEFIFDKGLDVTPEEKYLSSNNVTGNETGLWEDGEFITQKTSEDIKQWLAENKKNFALGTYHVATKNCLTFVKAFGDFLGGPEPERLKNEREWLIKNPALGNFFQSMLEAQFDMPTPAPPSG